MTSNLFSSPASTNEPWFTAHCDGGSRGNPGPSGYGAIVEDPRGHTVARLSQFLGIQTNNYAEYSGLLAVLEWAIENNAQRLRVVSDSELMVKQMKGQYKVASPVLRPLYDQARRLAAKLDKFEMRHTLRGGNKEADRLANEAMDRGMGKSREQGSGIREQGSGGDREQGRRPEAPSAASGMVSRGPSPEPGRPQPPKPGAPGPAPGTWETTKANSPNRKPARQVLEGYVKGGVVHLLEGELPDGIFVKIIRE